MYTSGLRCLLRILLTNVRPIFSLVRELTNRLTFSTNGKPFRTSSVGNSCMEEEQESRQTTKSPRQPRTEYHREQKLRRLDSSRPGSEPSPCLASRPGSYPQPFLLLLPSSAYHGPFEGEPSRATWKLLNRPQLSKTVRIPIRETDRSSSYSKFP